MTQLKIVVDRDLCESNGTCVMTAPSLFEIGADDQLHVRERGPDPGELAAAREAVRRCPKGALSLEDVR